MLKIRKRQIEAFEEASVEAFALEMADHLRSVLPDAVAGLRDDALADSVRRRLDQALSYGITDRMDARRYLECSFVLGWSDHGPDEEALAALSQEGLNVEEKLDVIEQRTASM
jgi:hypothetical protein